MPSLTGSGLPPTQGAATQLVVLLHGYGADGNDLIGLGHHWQRRLPGAVFAAPHAPDPVPGAAGFQWFGLSRMDPHELRHGVEAAAAALEEFITAELARWKLPPGALALAGFSQGAMLALHLGLGGRLKPACIVGFSGLLAAPPQPGETPILLTHGSDDEVIPASAMLQAASGLAAAGHGVQWHLAPRMGHGIDPAGLEMAGQFMALGFGGHLKAAGPLHCALRQV